MAAPETEDLDVSVMLRDSVRGLLDAHWRASDVGGAESDAEITALWNSLVDQGIAVLGADAEQGGLREILAVMEELGRAACPAPMWSAALANLVFTNASSDFARQMSEALHDGTARIAFSFGALDPDPGVGSIELRGQEASGSLRFVEAAGGATHLLVPVSESQFALVDLGGGGVVRTPTRAMGTWGACELVLDKAPAESIRLDDVSMEELQTIGRTTLLARAHGAACRAFELAVSYAKDRQQFGQPIGKFQAIQHKLANCFIDLEGVRLILGHAARLYDDRHEEWSYFANCAMAFAGSALRRCSLETQHTFGAIGYAEEHEAPLHFKRVHLDTIALGGAAFAKRRLASRLFDDGGVGLPPYDLGAAGNELRKDVKEWLVQHWSGDRKSRFDEKPFHEREFDVEFALDIGKTGWIGLGWPQQFGGQARTPLEQIAFMETMEQYEAPRIGASIQSNALMMFGTLEQQARYLPEILRGEAMHGMGYSEPQAGSDLAALSTSAVQDGAHWVINGQKIWTTTWWGKYMFLAARTDKNAKLPHAGISMFIVPMNSPGITVQPAATMYDGTFANIFYDKVRIPLENLVGRVNEGWKVLTGALAFERGLVGGGIVLKVAHAFEQLRRHLIANPDLSRDPVIRDRMAGFASEIEIGRQLMMHCADLASDGITPPEYGAISKVFSSELMERFGEAALDMLGMRAALSEQMPGAIDNGRFEQNLRHSLMWVISIGTNEIQRSLIAQRALGLPR
ncbi:acyl-CoA dehydrogenase [Bradyrhizobium sp.]|uniref:acyl-CoA dehydrogenase n=1 Tax=Bradyrhizobium sp. TaxID=376 RepID=UPI002C35E801|nr:acyl-CoA dehydrogenase family protein [Bradyrhizobium sp.]HMM88073.1 acyl-CoA dehydrogenase family protein [Bradyrhizobium sp.]